jgi:hypothetical protein
MATLAMLVGLGIAAMGVTLVIAPDWMLSLADWRSSTMKWSAAAARVAMGVVFLSLLLEQPTAFYRIAGVAATLFGLLIAALV